MPLLPISPPPGVCLSKSDYAGGKAGRWIAAENVEFIAGTPQKIAGWAAATTVAMLDSPRAMKVWRDQNGLARIGVGTESHLYYVQAGTVTDITPLRSIVTGTLSAAISTTNNSPVITVTDIAQNVANGDFVFVSASAAVGGVQPNGWYKVSGRTGTSYNITLSAAATSTAGPGGGTITFKYPRITLVNPFTTHTGIGSNIVTVHHVAHGAQAGNYVTYSGASAVGGLTINGEVQILGIIDVDNYTIAPGGAATSAATGGGNVSTIYDINVRQSLNSNAVGYGQGAYGRGQYGISVAKTKVLSDGWTLDAYGNQLLGAPVGGTIYVYDPVQGGRAFPLLNAPLALNAMFVTPERFVVALGVSGNPMQMAWGDQNDYTVWTTLPTNTANSGRTLVGGSFLVGGVGIRDGVSLVWTDRVAFQMNYTGDNLVYSTPQIGDNCGLVSPTAMATEGGIVYWFSDQDFWMWNGGVQPLQSDDVRAFVFSGGINLNDPFVSSGGINRSQIGRCTATLNRAKRQVRFYYPSPTATENDSGVIYQYDQQCFTTLDYGRSAASDAELLPMPVSTDIGGILFNDETGLDANGVALPCTLSLGFIDISNGDSNVDVFGFLPDFQSLSGIIGLTVRTKYYQSDTGHVDGPFNITSATGRIDLRADGRMAAFDLAMSNIATTFRLGLPRLDIQPAGVRK